MNASKENCEAAIRGLKLLLPLSYAKEFSKEQRVAIYHLEAFLEAAYEKLPKEVTYQRSKRRKKQYSK